MSTPAPLQEPQRKSMSHGLNSSIWASNDHENANLSRRCADWPCLNCNFANFHWRVDCFRCGLSKFTQGDRLVWPDNSKRPQEQIGAYNTQLMTQGLDETLRRQNGLSTSCWATSTYNSSRPTNVGRKQTQSQLQINQPLKNVYNISTASAAPASFCLPYEVQHYILTMMERIVEEGCFEFAARWDPEALIQNNWTCAEAVELSTWRTFFLNSIPSDAMSSTPLYVLEDAMADAVRLRNAAVHRHLCDNVEIRRMAVNAQGLMTLLSDVTRYEKFVRLESELREWDNGFQLDPAEKRWKLEVALLEISERPLDTMDWTPIREPIQETTSNVVGNSVANYYSDEMDVDYF